MENNTIIENENILNNNEHMNHNNLEMDHNNLNMNMGNGEETMNLNNMNGEENREEGDGDMKDDLLDSTMENDNLGNVIDGDNNELNDLNDELLNEQNNQNNTIMEDNNQNNDHNNVHNNNIDNMVHNNNNNVHNEHNENKTIVEDNNHTHHFNPNENTTLIHGSIVSPPINNNNNVVSQSNSTSNSDVKNEFNKRNIELEVEQLTKQRRLLEEERKRISDQIQFLENEDDEPPELTLSQCNTILNKIKKTHETIIWPFLEPVDHVKLGLVDYLEVVKNPMDLGTIFLKIKKKEYASYYGFVADLNLVWDNCILYNTEYTDIGRWAVDLKDSCNTLINEALKKKDGDKKKSFGGKAKTVSQIDEVKSFLEKIRSDPSVLKQPKFQFFKDFISTFDVNKI